MNQETNVNNMKKTRGFTLIEVMIVVVIVAILAAIAIPSYQSQIQKTRRADATSTLSQIAAAQERYFFTNNGYVTENAKLSDINASTESPDGHYAISISSDACDGNGCYELTATAQGSQANDSTCESFTVNHVGTRSAKKSDGTDSTENCW